MTRYKIYYNDKTTRLMYAPNEKIAKERAEEYSTKEVIGIEEV